MSGFWGKRRVLRRVAAIALGLLLSPFGWGADLAFDIAYAYEADSPALDLYLPDDDLPIPGYPLRPAVVLIHAGGWSSGGRAGLAELAERLANKGLVVTAVDYSLTPEHRWPRQFTDLAQAVWWLKKNSELLRIDPDKILAFGKSAGGHLAMMLGFQSMSHPLEGFDSSVGAVISLAGPSNLILTPTALQQDLVQDLLATDTLSSRAEASPVFKITGSAPPIMLIHGTEDEVVPFDQSTQICDAYNRRSMNHCILVPLEGVGHEVHEDDQLVISHVEGFIDDWLSEGI